MDDSAKRIFRQELAETYLSQINRVRNTLDDVEDVFLENRNVDINIYRNFEKEVIGVASLYSEKFVEAFKNYDFDEMKKLHGEVIEAIIELSQKITK